MRIGNAAMALRAASLQERHGLNLAYGSSAGRTLAELAASIAKPRYFNHLFLLCAALGGDAHRHRAQPVVGRHFHGATTPDRREKCFMLKIRRAVMMTGTEELNPVMLEAKVA